MPTNTQYNPADTFYIQVISSTTLNLLTYINFLMSDHEMRSMRLFNSASRSCSGYIGDVVFFDTRIPKYEVTFYQIQPAPITAFIVPPYTKLAYSDELYVLCEQSFGKLLDSFATTQKTNLPLSIMFLIPGCPWDAKHRLSPLVSKCQTIQSSLFNQTIPPSVMAKEMLDIRLLCSGSDSWRYKFLMLSFLEKMAPGIFNQDFLKVPTKTPATVFLASSKGNILHTVNQDDITRLENNGYKEAASHIYAKALDAHVKLEAIEAERKPRGCYC